MKTIKLNSFQELLQEIQIAESQFQAGFGVEHKKAKKQILAGLRDKKKKKKNFPT